jgi:hypothetical protein
MKLVISCMALALCAVGCAGRAPNPVATIYQINAEIAANILSNLPTVLTCEILDLLVVQR